MSHGGKGDLRYVLRRMMLATDKTHAHTHMSDNVGCAINHMNRAELSSETRLQRILSITFYRFQVHVLGLTEIETSKQAVDEMQHDSDDGTRLYIYIYIYIYIHMCVSYVHTHTHTH